MSGSLKAVRGDFSSSVEKSALANDASDALALKKLLDDFSSRIGSSGDLNFTDPVNKDLVAFLNTFSHALSLRTKLDEEISSAITEAQSQMIEFMGPYSVIDTANGEALVNKYNAAQEGKSSISDYEVGLLQKIYSLSGVDSAAYSAFLSKFEDTMAAYKRAVDG